MTELLQVIYRYPLLMRNETGKIDTFFVFVILREAFEAIAGLLCSVLFHPPTKSLFLPFK
ncbi:hypothetical protein AB685_15935 [Bacillus sp. LL01]|nr:hypothetical protein AB685_15935 [Bacillus sp. LL01]